MNRERKREREREREFTVRILLSVKSCSKTLTGTFPPRNLATKKMRQISTSRERERERERERDLTRS